MLYLGIGSDEVQQVCGKAVGVLESEGGLFIVDPHIHLTDDQLVSQHVEAEVLSKRCVTLALR